MTLTNLIDAGIRVVDKIQNFRDNVERKVSAEMLYLKRSIQKVVIIGIFYLIGLVLLVSGAVLFFSRFFALDLVLLAFGFLAIYLAAMMHILRR